MGQTRKALIVWKFISLERWVPMVNVVPDQLNFSGWLKIHGMPLCGGLVEIDSKTQSLLDLNSAQIKVRSRGVHSIPQTIPLLDRNVWFYLSVEGEKMTESPVTLSESTHHSLPKEGPKAPIQARPSSGKFRDAEAFFRTESNPLEKVISATKKSHSLPLKNRRRKSKVGLATCSNTVQISNSWHLVDSRLVEDQNKTQKTMGPSPLLGQASSKGLPPGPQKGLSAQSTLETPKFLSETAPETPLSSSRHPQNSLHCRQFKLHSTPSIDTNDSKDTKDSSPYDSEAESDPRKTAFSRAKNPFDGKEA
uniref:Uncharacterized protein n=1 Tax=Nelumbo nucifera TaxID=4432 RepID=A0A822Y4S5_NELNU|nr:TPA_asm: hypothetical protein HUJ06_027503 [Nelumbo nucifera]